MRFDLKSVLLNDGVVIKIKVHAPDVFDNLSVPIEVWHKSVIEFNKYLNERKSVTQEVAGVLIDILTMDDRNQIQFAVQEKDVDMIGNLWFSIKGQIIFKANSTNAVEEVVITDLVYKNKLGEFQSALK